MELVKLEKASNQLLKAITLLRDIQEDTLADTLEGMYRQLVELIVEQEKAPDVEIEI